MWYGIGWVVVGMLLFDLVYFLLRHFGIYMRTVQRGKTVDEFGRETLDPVSESLANRYMKKTMLLIALRVIPLVVLVYWLLWIN